MNGYLQTMAPWSAKHSNDPYLIETPIYLAAESLRLVGILMQPVMPESAGRLLDMLGVEDTNRGYQHAVLGADTSYGVSKVNLGKGHKGALFPPLASEEV